MGAFEIQQRAQRLEEAKDRLRCSMAVMPFDLARAGSTRIAAWKAAHRAATKLLARAPADASRYDEARRGIMACGGDMRTLAAQLFPRSE